MTDGRQCGRGVGGGIRPEPIASEGCRSSEASKASKASEAVEALTAISPQNQGLGCLPPITAGQNKCDEKAYSRTGRTHLR